jgi:hypothetical protein
MEVKTMNSRKNTALLISVLVLVLAGLALAGVEPSPFKPFNWLNNKLGSVENVLSAVDYKLEKILTPEPCTPPDPCKLAEMLYTIADRLIMQNNLVVAVIDAFPPDVPPDPCREFLDALGKVRVKAQSISDKLDDFTPPDPCREALEAANIAANAIIDTIDAAYPD